MIPVTQLRAGTTFQEKGEPFLVLKYEHLKLGRGTANIKVKVKNLKTGATGQRVFVSGARVEEVQTTRRRLQYLYQDGQNLYFLDPKTFEQHEIPIKAAEDQARFLQEQTIVEILFLDGQPLVLGLPPKMIFKVSKTFPGVKGDSATNVFKEATLENGVRIKVPLFIKEGEKIVIDTRTGEYGERAKD